MHDHLVQRVASATPPKLARRIRGVSDRTIAWLFVTPTILLLLAVNIFPLIWTIRLSLTNYRTNRPNNPIEFVGFDNYRKILTNPDTWASLQATAHFLIWTIVLQVAIGFALAYLINKKFRGNDLWTTLIVLPMMLSPAVVGNFWTFLYQPQIGLFNYFIEFISGIDPASFSMIGDVSLAPWTIVLVDTWMWTPFVMLICLAGLRSIPPSIYEAAECRSRQQVAAVLDHHAADGAALPDAGGAVPGHRELQDVRPRGAAHRRRPRRHDPADLDRSQARSLSRNGAPALPRPTR